MSELIRRILFLHPKAPAADAAHTPAQKALAMAGLSEERLRKMDPDDRVAVLEQAQLDPYDYIYLAC